MYPPGLLAGDNVYLACDSLCLNIFPQPVLYLMVEYITLKTVIQEKRGRLPFSFVRWSPFRAEDERLYLGRWIWRRAEGAGREKGILCRMLQ